MAGNSSALDTALVRGRSQILNTRITEPEMLDRAFSTYGVTPDGYPSCLLLMMLMGIKNIIAWGSHLVHSKDWFNMKPEIMIQSPPPPPSAGFIVGCNVSQVTGLLLERPQHGSLFTH